MLAGVDHVLMGAGNPGELPALLDRLAQHAPVELAVRVQGALPADADRSVRFDPAPYADAVGPLTRPRFDAIVASVDLATALAGMPRSRPDGFIVEGHTAGGHNAPPRGPRREDATGQLIYDAADIVDPTDMAAVGLPFWMAGSYATPSGLARARAAGARGIQAGTIFALCQESGMAPAWKQQLLELAAGGRVPVRTHARASPTGFPFKVVDLPGTLADESVYAGRLRVCDLGVLRTAYRRSDGGVGYRCPAEPIAIYERHGKGRPQNTVDRRCLCNGLMATADLAQQRPGGYAEPAIVTAGTDFTGVRDLLARGRASFSAAEAVAYLLGQE
jgi:NAD(P)H-dependent flavin oxidoreductase YrpB (nitropropane dioxygenase family)